MRYNYKRLWFLIGSLACLLFAIMIYTVVENELVSIISSDIYTVGFVILLCQYGYSGTKSDMRWP